MLSLRILGGPIPKTEKVLIDVTPSTTFDAMFPMIQAKLFELGVITAHDDVHPSAFDLVELEFVEGGKARPARILSLGDSPKSAKLQTPALFLRARPQGSLVSSGSFRAASAASGSAATSPEQDALRYLPTSSALSGTYLPPILAQQRRNSSGSFQGTMGSSDELPSPTSASGRSAAAAVPRTARERLAGLYGVPIGDLHGMLSVDRCLRKAQMKGRVEFLLAVAERALIGAVHHPNEDAQTAAHTRSDDDDGAQQHCSASDSSGVPHSTERGASKFAMMGSPTQLIRRMRAHGMLAPEKRSTVLSLTAANCLLQLVHRDCAAALNVVFDPTHLLAHREQEPLLPAEYRTFVAESGPFPRASVATLLLKLFLLKFVRRDFELFEQQERFRGYRTELLRAEGATRNVVQLMFYTLWCTMQQGFLALEEQETRADNVLAEELHHRRDIVLACFASFEDAVRRGYMEVAEGRHRWQYLAYHIQTVEHHHRRAIVEQYWVAQRLLELERDFAMASQVMQRIFRRALVGYHELSNHKLVDLEHRHRHMLAKKEWGLRLLMFEMLEQLYRQWLEQTVLTWLEPVVEKIAAKAIADGKLLLALEMKEMRNVRAREEARLRVLIRQNSSVHF